MQNYFIHSTLFSPLLTISGWNSMHIYLGICSTKLCGDLFQSKPAQHIYSLDITNLKLTCEQFMVKTYAHSICEFLKFRQVKWVFMLHLIIWSYIFYHYKHFQVHFLSSVLNIEQDNQRPFPPILGLFQWEKMLLLKDTWSPQKFWKISWKEKNKYTHYLRGKGSDPTIVKKTTFFKP